MVKKANAMARAQREPALASRDGFHRLPRRHGIDAGLAEDGPPAIGGRPCPLARDEAVKGGPDSIALEEPRLAIEARDCAQFLVAAELGLADRRFEDADGLVIDFERYRERVAVLAAVGEREARRIAEPARAA